MVGGVGVVVGVALLLSASLLWGCYTLGLRGSGLDPIGCALVLALPSTLVLLYSLAVEDHSSKILICKKHLRWRRCCSNCSRSGRPVGIAAAGSPGKISGG